MNPIPYSSLSFETKRRLKATSNYADHTIHFPKVCCAWMDFHTDYDDIYNYEVFPFKIKIIYSHPNAVLVHKVNNRYCIDELEIGSIVTFNQLQQHGLVPRKLADKIVAVNRVNVPGYKKWKRKVDGNAFKAKCIWEWVE